MTIISGNNEEYYGYKDYYVANDMYNLKDDSYINSSNTNVVTYGKGHKTSYKKKMKKSH